MKFNRILIKNEEEFNNMLNVIKHSNKIAVDTENGNTEGIEDSALNPSYAKPAGISLTVDGKNSYYIPINHTDYKNIIPMNRIKEIFENKKLLIMQNCVYDVSIFKAQYRIDLTKGFKFYDTMIAQHLIDEYNSKGLKQMTERYFGIKQQKFQWADACTVSAEEMYRYACDDAIYTYLHYLRTKEEIKKQKFINLMMNIEMPFQRALIHMKLNGISFDVEGCKKLEQELLEDKQKVIDKILEVTPEIPVTKNLLGGTIINMKLDSTKDLTSLLFDKLNLISMKETPTGAPAVDKEALNLLKDDFGNWQHPIVPLLLKYSEIQKLLNSFTHSLYEKVINGRIYTDFLDHGTSSGRLSSRGPNFQQLPKASNPEKLKKKYESYKDDNLRKFFLDNFVKSYDIRRFFKASDGYKMYVSDFGQEELRVAGVITKSEAFKNAFNNQQDLHLKVANDIWKLGIPEEALVESHPDYEKYKDDNYKERFNAKSVNFGLLYGRTAHGLAPQLQCSVEEAQKIVNEYFETFPDVKRAMDMTRREILVKGYIRNLYGRKRRFFKIEKNGRKFYPPSALRQAFNTKIQGSCSDILRQVMAAVLDYIEKQPNDEIRMLMTIHDEIVFEIKEDSDIEKHIKNINHLMQNTVKLDIPLTTDGQLGDNYAEAK